MVSVVCLAPEFVAYGQHVVGNPGDPVRLLVAESRDDARIIVIKVKPEILDAVNEAAGSFYRDHYLALESVLRDARLEWPLDAVWTHCAMAVRAELTIYFSYSKCQQSVRGKTDAIKLLFHEATHLLGNENEQLADDVANSVYNTWLNIDSNTTPRWDALNPNGSPLERSAHASVEFRDTAGKQKIFVWGGCNENDDMALECSNFLGDGAIYDVERKSWAPVLEPIFPGRDELELKRAFSTAVYTGNQGPVAGKIIVYGGCSGPDHVCRKAWGSALIYDLATAAWTIEDAATGVVGRIKHHAFWTGSRMLVWGGVTDPAGSGLGQSLADGAVFDPAMKSWRKLSAEGSPSPRRFASVVLTGSEENPQDRKLIVFGGCDRQVGRYCPRYFKDGGIYDLKTDTWRSLDAGTFGARAWHSAVWTGTQMIVWGGLNRSPLRDGVVFTPGDNQTADTWFQISGVVDDGRWGHGAAWTGDRMLVWGGQARLGEPAAKILEFYLPSSAAPFGRWSSPQSLAAPVGRWQHSMHWLGHGLLVWGGTSELRSYLNSGGIFYPHIGP